MRVSASWLVVILVITSCGLNQFRPWLDESGQRLEGSQLIEYRGFEECGHDDVVFLVFFGDMYAKDTEGVLGELRNASDEVLTYALLDEVPPGVIPTGLTSGEREIYVDEATRADYLYVHATDGRTERWPRAEFPCDLPGAASG